MTESTATEVQELVQQGRAAALAGDTYAARASFRRATELDPKCVDAWAGLSGVVPILAEKREYLQRALDLEPDNADITASLRYVEQLQAEGVQIEPSRRRAERLATSDGSPLLSTPEPVVIATEIEYCYRHPDRETGLHCSVCGRPICGECAVMTSVGQLCPDDRKARRPVNYQVSARDVIIGGLVGLLASALVALPLTIFTRGFFGLIIIFMAGPAIAEFIVRVVDRVTKLKRGRPMQITVAVAIVLGTLPFALVNWWMFLYMALAVATAVARLR